MKILVISNYFPPYFKGGYELSCKAMTDYLYNHSEDVTVLAGDYKEGNKDEPNYDVRRQLKYIDYTNGSYFDKCRVEKINYNTTVELLKEIRPDIVYFWNQQYISLAPYLAVKKMGIKHLFDIGDIWPEKYKRSGFSNKIKSIIKRLIPSFIEGTLVLNPVVILSEWMREIVVNNHLSRDVYVIPRGVAINKTVSSKNDNANVRLMYASRIEPLKGLEFILESLSQVSNTNWTLDVYGSGDESYVNEVKSSCRKLNLSDKVHFKGMVYPLDSEYDKHDVFLFPTLAKEGFGRVAIEAMSWGLPVVTVDRFGPGDIVINGYNGFKCSPDNQSEWVDSLSALIKDKELRIKMSINSLDTIKDKYDINVIHKKRHDIIKEICKS